MDKKKPMIVFTKYTPYHVVGLDKITTASGNVKRLGPVTTLCRCGNSKSKPYCDESHNKHGGLNEEKADDRKRHELKSYEGAHITIYFHPEVCSHDGHCVRCLPTVFKKDEKPWINPDGDTAKAIVKTIEMCPSGALSYGFGNTRIQNLDRAPAMTTRKNGPYHITGGVQLFDDQSSEPEAEEHYVLCRCGHSKNKPFCDGSHDKSDFQAE